MTEDRKSRQPSFVIDNEITTKNGQVITTRIGALFARDDGRHGGKLDYAPMNGGEIVISTPEQRLERMKQQKEKAAEKDIER